MNRFIQIIAIIGFLGAAQFVSAEGGSVPPVQIRLTLDLPQGENAHEVEARVPPLKFDKRLLMSYTLDDDTVTAYCNIFSCINQHWITRGVFFNHLGYPHSTGFLPEKTLGYSDGTGIEKRFAIGVAVWPQSGNKWLPNFMDEKKPPTGPYDPYLKWYEIPTMLDFGCSVYEHDTCTDAILPPDASKEVRDASYKDADMIARCFPKCLEITKRNLNGRGFKVLIEPNGNYTYCVAARKFPPIKVVVNQGAGGKSIKLRPLSMVPDFETSVLERRFYNNCPIEEEFAHIEKLASDPDPIWYHLSTHGASDSIMQLLRLINDRWGKDGSDEVWFATVDEYYEYCFMRKGIRIEKRVKNDRQVEFLLTIPQDVDFHYQDLSLVVEGLARPELSRATADTSVYALSFAKKEDRLLINVGFNPESPRRAERYVARLEEERSKEAKRDAEYFVSQLRPELQPPFEKRIAAVSLRQPIEIRKIVVERSDPTRPRERRVIFETDRRPHEYKACIGWLDPESVPWVEFDPEKPILVTIPEKSRFLRADNTIDVAVVVRDSEGESRMVGTTISAQ
ncbi:MAG: hypothetical protein Q4D38_10330 [Planctomycetia bacterium]|nr:hypothetical protein [Planctomycetia bacterium]